MNPVQAARKALIEAKSAFEADGSSENLATLEAKGLALSEAIDAADRAQKATNILGAIAENGAGEQAGDTATQDSNGMAAKFFESPQYKSYVAGGGQSGSNAERSIALPSVKLGSYVDVMEGKAALQTPLAHAQALRYPMIDQIVRDELTLMDLISTGRIAAQSLQYVQIVSVTRNAALQPENTGDKATDTLKPLSDMATQLETAHVFGYADGYVVTTQMLADAPAFASFMDGELRYGIRRVQEDYLLNGSGTGGEPRGILNTTGVQADTYDGSGAQPIKALVEKVRTGIRKVAKVGGSTTAILLHPEDNEQIDLMKEADGAYTFGGPAQVGAQTLWGRPRVTSEKIERGQVILGDFKQIAYLDRDGISVEAFNQHEDFARRNLVYVRAEARGLQAIWRPSRLLILEEA